MWTSIGWNHADIMGVFMQQHKIGAVLENHERKRNVDQLRGNASRGTPEIEVVVAQTSGEVRLNGFRSREIFDSAKQLDIVSSAGAGRGVPHSLKIRAPILQAWHDVVFGWRLCQQGRGTGDPEGAKDKQAHR